MPQERLMQAVDALATSAAPIQRRLLTAGVALAPLRPEDFADSEHRQEFEQLMAALTAREPAGEEGSLEATTTALSDQEAAELARRIVALDVTYRPLA